MDKEKEVDGADQTNQDHMKEPESSFSSSEQPVEKNFFTDDEGRLVFVNRIVRCPCISLFLAIILALGVSIIALAVAFGGSNKNPFTDDQAQFALNDIRSIKYDTLRLASEAVSADRNKVVVAKTPLKTQSTSVGIFYWIYEAKTSQGIFTKDALMDIYNAETEIMNDNLYKNYCLREYDNTTVYEETECARPLSATVIFFAEKWDSVLVKNVTARLKDSRLAELYKRIAPCLEFGINCAIVLKDVSSTDEAEVRKLSNDLTSIMRWWNGKNKQVVGDPKEIAEFCALIRQFPTRSPFVDFYFDANFTLANPTSMYSRSLYRFGGPLKGYKLVDGKEGDEQDSELKKWIIDNHLKSIDKATSSGYSKFVNVFYFMSALIFDVLIRIILYDAMNAIISILLVFFYIWYMVGSGFLAVIGMVEILLSLPTAWFFVRCIFQIKYFGGLNMLCIFIVCAIGADDIFVFMDAYNQSKVKGRHVNKDMATRMSWVYRKSGLAMLITSATTCAAFLCCLSSPIAGTQSFGIFAAFVILADYLYVMSIFCTAVVVYHDYFEKPPLCQLPGCCGCCVKDCSRIETSSTVLARQNSHEDGRESEAEDKITVFFSTTFANLILDYRSRIAIALVLIGWLIPAVIYTTKLTPTTKTEQFLKDSHPLQKSITILNEKFPTSTQDRGLDVFYAWGLEDISRSGVNQLLDDKFLGEAKFAPSWTFTPACQQKIFEVCQRVLQSQDLSDLIKLKDDGTPSHRCFLYEWKDVIDKEGWKNSQGWVDTNQVDEKMQKFLAMPTKKSKSNQLVLDYYNELGADQLGFDGKKLKYVAISVEAKHLDRWNNPSEAYTRKYYDWFNNLGDEFNKIAEAECGKVTMTDMDQKFIFMNNQMIYRTSAIQGAGIGVVIAFGVLVLATRSLLISVLSCLSILATIVSVIGLTTMMGWQLGTIQAILFSILAGFSVDYVVHLAHSYATCSGTREERIRKAFAEMGSPVLSGMLTSVLASIPLFLCQVVFFSVFGTFLCFTILFSWIFANFGFMSIMATIGPQTTDKKEESTTDLDRGSNYPVPVGEPQEF